MFSTLISVAQLAARPVGSTVLIDCRHQLPDPAYGRRVYAEGHLPGAHFLHLMTICPARAPGAMAATRCRMWARWR